MKIIAAIILLTAGRSEGAVAESAGPTYLNSQRASIRDAYCGAYVSKAASLTKPLGDTSRQYEDFRMKAARIGAELLVTSDIALRNEGSNLQDTDLQSSLRSGGAKAADDWTIVEHGGGANALTTIINRIAVCTKLLPHDGR